MTYGIKILFQRSTVKPCLLQLQVQVGPDQPDRSTTLRAQEKLRITLKSF